MFFRQLPKSELMISFRTAGLALCLLLLGAAGYAQAEVWKCGNGVYRNAPARDEKCVPVQTGVQCMSGKRVFGPANGSAGKVEKCPVPVKAARVEAASNWSSAGRNSAADWSDDTETVSYEPVSRFSRRGPGPATQRMMEDSLQNSRIDWGSKIDEVKAGRDPFPGLTPEKFASGQWKGP